MLACFALCLGLLGAFALVQQRETIAENAAEAESFNQQQTGATAPTSEPGPEAPSPEDGELLWFDTFDTPGSPTTAPSGQPYLTHQTNNQLPVFVDGALHSEPQDATSVGSGYIAVRLDQEPVHIVQEFTISGEGDGQNSAVSIVPGHGATIPEIIDRDVHIIHTRTGVNVQVRDKATNDFRNVDTFEAPLERGDGTEYRWSITRTAPDTIEVVDALGTRHTSTDPAFAELWGPDVYIQAVNQANDTPPGDVTTVTGIWVYAAPAT